MSDIDSVRINTADRPVFHHEEVEQNETGNTYFKLDYNNILASPAPIVRKNGSTQTETTHYVVDYANGSITFVAAPTVGDSLVFEYTSVVYTDAEVQTFLDGASGSVTLASARMLYAWAADAARLAYKESRSGGGNLGSITVDTSVRARELRLTADALMKQYNQFEGTGEPAEYVTEIAWTQAMADRMVVNKVIEDLG